jgi:tripartite-type tricarboxylate transporter receptor subunit TctC
MARDLTAIAEVAAFPSAIVLHPSLPANSVKELIALARARPGRLSFGSAGIGSPNHLSLELFQAMAGVSMVHVPYKGSGQLVGDLLAGQVQLASMGLPVAVPHVQSGKLRAADIVAKLNSEIGSAVTAPDVKERLAALGAEPSVKAPDQFGRYVREEIAKWAKVVKDSGAKAE